MEPFNCGVAAGLTGGSGRRLRLWLDAILWEKTGGADILRLKGLVNLQSGSGRKVVQAVQEVYDIHDARPQSDGQPELNEIVLIGRNMDEQALTASLLHCLM